MHNGYNVVVNTGNIKLKKMNAFQKYDELYNMVQTYQKMIDETDAIYDTLSAKEYRVVAHKYLDMVLLYLRSDFKEYIDKLDTIIDTYNNYYTLTGINVGKSDKNEV